MPQAATSESWASSAAVRRTMLGNRRTETSPERRLRSVLHGRGLRFRKELPLRADSLTTRPDVLFTTVRVAVYVDGCFWHRCPEHGTAPRTNVDYWLPKLERNVQRDRRVNAALADAGWLVVRVWEHEDADAAADRVVQAIASRRNSA